MVHVQIFRHVVDTSTSQRRQAFLIDRYREDEQSGFQLQVGRLNIGGFLACAWDFGSLERWPCG